MIYKPWRKRLEETSKQFEAFCIYRDLGPDRTISEVAKQWSQSGATSRLREWANKNEWQMRAEAYDEHIDEIRRFSNEQAIIEMSERHAREAVLFQDKALERLKSLDISKMKPHDVIKFYEDGVKIERLSRGVPTENIKQEQEIKEAEKDVITPEKLKDPEVRERANQFIKVLADSQSSSDGISTDGK